MSRIINNIVIHCADTPDGKPFTVTDIDLWHQQRGFHRNPLWLDRFNGLLVAIGYHFIIYTDGTVHTGRHVDEIGAHVAGANSDSLGICMIGRSRFTPEQWGSLEELVNNLKLTYPNARLRGHCEFASAIAQGKKCPNFDVASWAVDFVPDDKHILEVA